MAVDPGGERVYVTGWVWVADVLRRVAQAVGGHLTVTMSAEHERREVTIA